MKTKALLVTLALTGVLVACADRPPHPMDMTAAVESAKTPADHAALAQHYEDAAKEMESKAEEHKQILAQFKKDPYHYPKEYLSMNFENHCKRLISIYENAAQENLEMAAIHRQMAGVKP